MGLWDWFVYGTLESPLPPLDRAVRVFVWGVAYWLVTGPGKWVLYP